MRRTEWIALLCLALVAVLPRAGYLAELRRDPRLGAPTLESAESLAWAEAEASGDWSRLPSGLERLSTLPQTPFLRAPGYPWWLAGWFRLAGTDRIRALAAQQALGLLGVLLTWWGVRRWVSSRAAWFSGVALALYWPDIYYAGEFLDASLLTVLLLLMMLAAGCMADCAVVPDPDLRRPRACRCLFSWAAITGIALGVAILVRPGARCVLPVLVLWILWVMWRRRNPSLRATALKLMRMDLPEDRSIDVESDVLLESMDPGQWARWKAALRMMPDACRLARPAWIGLLAGLLLVVTPVLVRNARLGGALAPIAVGDAVSALVASLPEYDGFDDDDLGAGRRLDRACDYGQLAEVAGSGAARDIVRHFQRTRWELFLAQPEAVGRTLARRLLLFWGPLEVGSARVAEYDRLASGVLRALPVSFALLLTLALFGVAQWLLERRVRSQQASEDEVAARVVVFAMPLLSAGVLTAWMAGHSRVLASGHWRHPLAPCLAFLAAWAFEDLRQSLAARRWKEVGLWGLTGVCLYLAVSQNLGGYVPNRAKWLLDRGLALEAQGRREAALVAFRTVLMTTPGVRDPESGVLLADSSIERPADVRRFQEAAAVACMKLGIAAVQQREAGLALRYFEQAARLEPERSEALINAGRVLLESGRTERAVAALTEAVRRDGRALPAYYTLAQALYRLGRYEESSQWLTRLLDQQPDHPQALRLQALLPAAP